MRQQSQLAKVLALVEPPDILVDFQVVFHPDFAVSFGDEEEARASLALAHDHILRQVKPSQKIVDQEVDDVLVALEDWVAFDRI